MMMSSELTEKQKFISKSSKSRIVVKACPGSGKTYSVASRVARLLGEENFKHQGIAIISFTKVAAEEIKKNLKDNYDIKELPYPHFVGTIDSFINHKIFLPFGHLILGCSSRPEVVGTDHNPWFGYDATIRRYQNKRVVYRDPNEYFDKVSFSANEEPIPLVPPSNFHFSWKKRTKDGNYYKDVRDIIDAKHLHFKQGKANQADANFIALKVLNKYPLILSGLAKRYAHLIIDEAQDTTEAQMGIVDKIDNAGIKNILFVGDPDQAVFEWNTAEPALFLEKYNDPNYFKIELSENRRSSMKICQLLDAIVASKSSSIADVKDDPNIPHVVGYTSKENVEKIKLDFFEKCRELKIQQSRTAVVYRGKSFGEEYFDLVTDEPLESPWKDQHSHVRDIVHGKLLMEKGKYRDSLRLFERGYHKLKNRDMSYVTQTHIRESIVKKGFKAYRSELFSFIRKIPNVDDKDLLSWIVEANSCLMELGYTELMVNNRRAKINIKRVFQDPMISERPFTQGTIHSVKGQTFDAVLLFLKKKATKNYVNLFSSKYKEEDLSKKKKDKEELRLVYVACSRPKKLLWVAVPESDVDAWNGYLGLARM